MTTKFVQFNDGQVWEGSDPKTVSEIAAQRKDSIAYLNEVLAAPDIKAAIAKVNRAERDANGVLLTSRVAERSLLKLLADPTALAKERLSNADEHAAWNK
jgi:hypothetical protein